MIEQGNEPLAPGTEPHAPGTGSPPPGTEARSRRLGRLGRRLRGALPFAAGMVATLVGLVLYGLLVPGPRPLTIQEVNEGVAQALASATLPPARSALVYEAVRPSLVLIETHAPGTSEESGHGIGSGVIVDDRGAILTSLHVVAGATDIQITFADGTQSSAQIIASQPEIDIAVLRAIQPPAGLVPATLGNPNAVRVGDEAFVVGNPFGLYSSMSTGVVSGFDRAFRIPNGNRTLRDLIQIDAAVNPGNSGGPLLNRDGQVIGIVVALMNPTEQEVFVGIGLAVPINVAGGAAGLPPY